MNRNGIQIQGIIAAWYQDGQDSTCDALHAVTQAVEAGDIPRSLMTAVKWENMAQTRSQCGAADMFSRIPQWLLDEMGKQLDAMKA